jgi:hypothetical protein
MTKDDSLFSSISKINGRKITFWDNLKGKVIGVGNIGGKSSPSIEKVFLVNNLKHNLLSISQLYDKGYKIMFDHALRVWINSWHWWGIVIKRKNLKERASLSGVIAWCGFINGIISFTRISKRVQYSNMVGTWDGCRLVEPC